MVSCQWQNSCHQVQWPWDPHWVTQNIKQVYTFTAKHLSLVKLFAVHGNVTCQLKKSRRNVYVFIPTHPLSATPTYLCYEWVLPAMGHDSFLSRKARCRSLSVSLRSLQASSEITTRQSWALSIIRMSRIMKLLFRNCETCEKLLSGFPLTIIGDGFSLLLEWLQLMKSAATSQILWLQR